MTVGIPQWFCLMQNPMDTARKCGGLSDVILLMGGELKEKTEQAEEEFAISDDKRTEFEQRLREAKLHGTYTKERTCGKYHVCNNQLYEYLEKFGKYAHGKRIPREALCLPREKAKYFFDGYMSGDGRSDREEATSTSAALILGMCIIAQRLGKSVPAVYYTRRDEKCVIQGRECRQRDTYTFRISSKSVKGHYRARYVCRELYQPTESDDFGTVYNISVEEDNSYVANGAIVHNCQDISVAGKQLGFQGNRSSLFFRVMYLIGQLKEEDKPTYLFIENVKNLLSVNGGWDFARLLIEMDRGGYDAEWQVLNSKDFGVPQNMERCFIIGHLRGRSSAKVFPVERTDGENSISMIGHRDGYRRNMQVFSPDGITETLDTGQGGGRGAYVSINILNKDYNHAHEAVYDTDGIIGTLMARDYKDPKRVCIPVLTPDRVEKRQNGRRFKEDGEPMFTLTGQDRHGVAVEPIGIIDPQGRKTKVVVPKDMVPTLRSQTHGNEPNVCFNVWEDKDSNSKHGIFVKLSAELTVYAVWYEKYQCYIAIRKLTPKECFRLQGWTDDYFEKSQFVNSDSQLYKQAGNGVTVSVIKAIAENMKVGEL